MALKFGITIYTLTVQELREMFAKELGVSVSEVSVEANNVWVGYGSMEQSSFGGLKVTVKKNASESDER